MACALLFICGAGVVMAGDIDPMLQDVMATSPDQAISVLVFMKDQFDVKAVDKSLKAARASAEQRYSTVVSGLQQKARMTQSDLRGELEDLKAQGKIVDYRPFWISNMIQVRAVPAEIERIAARSDVGTIYYDFRIVADEPVSFECGEPGGDAVAQGVHTIRADEVWELGITGKGTLVSNLDTGVKGDHEALADRWAGTADPHYAGHPEWAWQDLYYDPPFTSPVDPAGHGTHTMGTMCGKAPEEKIGVAPEAMWIASNAILADLNTIISNAIAGFEWIMNPDGDTSTTWDVPDVCSNSWGLLTEHGFDPCYDSLWSFIDACEAAGVVVVFSAGNSDTVQIGRPADRATDLYRNCAIGAINSHEEGWPVASFSSRGYSYCTPDSTPAIKPDLTAPGVNVRSAWIGGFPCNSSDYCIMNGTSMASPHVAGVIALMREANPDLTPDEVKQILYETAVDLGEQGKDTAYGWGVIDAFEAVMKAMENDPLAILAHSPKPNSFTAGTGTQISVTFNHHMNDTTITSASFIVYGRSSGPHSGVVSYDDYTRQAVFVPDVDFAKGEPVTVVLTTGIETTEGESLPQNYLWSFVVESDSPPGAFGALDSYAAGDATHSVFAADLDGDNDLDIFTAEYYSHAAGVFLNDGTGRFVRDTSYNLGSTFNPWSATLADFDGDGDIDAALADYNLGRVVLLYNDGGGGFTVGPYYIAHPQPQTIFSGDFDGDKDIDLVTANRGSDDISILMNNGDGTFATAVNYATGTDPISGTAIDIEGDGDLDLAIVNSGQAKVAVLLNDGTGAFTSDTAYSTPFSPLCIASADLDGDGDLDLATVNWTNSSASVLKNDGNGRFTVRQDYSVGTGPYSIITSDINGDGFADLTTANFTSDNVSVLLNDTEGGFEPQTTYATGDSPFWVFAADFNGDGYLDLTTADYLGDDISVMLTLDSPHIVSTSPTINEVAVPVACDITVDFDRDMVDSTITSSTFLADGKISGSIAGLVDYTPGQRQAIFRALQPVEPGDYVTAVLTPDILSGEGVPLESGYAVTFKAATQPGTGTFASPVTYSTPVKPITVCAADFDGDGLLDIASAEYVGDTISVFVGAGDGTFSLKEAFESGHHPKNITSADIDDDGDIDLIAVGIGFYGMTLYYNNGNGTFGAGVDISIGNNSQYCPYGVVAADLDADGLLDVAISTTVRMIVMKNDGGGAFTKIGDYIADFEAEDLCAADLDNDGDIDLAAVCNQATLYYKQQFLQVFRNRGDGTFPPREMYETTMMVFNVDAADLNNDGYADLIAANRVFNAITVMFNDTEGGFGPPVVYYVGNDVYCVHAADMDGDGDQDILSADLASDNVTVLFNEDGVFPTSSTLPVGDGPIWVDAADFNRDGMLDIYTADYLGNTISVMLNRLNPPDAPDLVAPIDNYSTFDPEITLDWDDASLADTYEVVVDDDSLFGSIDRTESGLVETEWLITPPPDAGTWYWKVRAANEAGPGPWSEVRHFTYLAPIVVPTDYSTIQEAIDSAVIVGTIINVLPGVYQENINFLGKTIRLIGAGNTDTGDTTFLEPAVADNPTVLMTNGESAGTELSGFTIRDGGDTYTVTIGNGASPLIANNVFYDNILCGLPNDDEVHDIFLKPNSPDPGGSDGDVNAVNGEIPGPPPPPPPCGYNKVIIKCVAPSGTPVIRNNLFYHNGGISCVGIWTDAYAEIINDTFDDNPRGFLTISSNGGVALNNIVTNSDEYGIYGNWTVLDYNDVWSNNPNYQNANPGPNNISADPVYVNLGNRDYHLQMTSPCIDAGHPDPQYNDPDGSRNDMGAFPYDGGGMLIKEPVSVPSAFSLSQNYPNPFNPSTRIDYSLPGPCHVEIAIFNILGQRVTTLVDQDLDAGPHTVEWQGKDSGGHTVASGIYFYRIKTDAFIESKKMVLMK